MNLANPVIAVLIAIGIWWLSTGLVLGHGALVDPEALGRWQLLPAITLVGVAGFLLLLNGSESRRRSDPMRGSSGHCWSGPGTKPPFDRNGHWPAANKNARRGESAPARFGRLESRLRP
jgi:hypothetical protein